MTSAPDIRTGVSAAALAFFIWGLSPAYWKLLDAVTRGELLAHRIVWSFVFMLALVLLRRRGREVRQVVASPGRLALVGLRGLLLSVNWLVFLWGVQRGHIVECSLGYYINPLVNVLLGAVFLGERMTKRQVVSVFLAVLAVANLVVRYGRVPWVALALAGSFGFYGLLRKASHVPAVPGFAAECAVMAPLAALFLLAAPAGSAEGGGVNGAQAALLAGGGVLTSLPLILFAYGVRRVRLATVGFLQYLAPTCQFLLGVFAYGETFTRLHFVTFVLIWLAVGLYCWDAVLAARDPRGARRA
jgi:chloramphenicol-sensitive protein RarD